MNLLTTLKRLYRKVITRLGHRPIWETKNGHTITYAFTSGGLEYFKVEDVFNTHTLRGISSVEIHDRWNMRMDRDKLIEYIDAISAEINNPKEINLVKVGALIQSMRDRMNYAIPPREIMWDLFCATYFDKSESPYMYDPEYQKIKKKRLQEAGDVDDFFLYTRLSELVPLPKLSSEDLAAALRVVSSMENINSQILSGQS